jgi:hypothetical protein
MNKNPKASVSNVGQTPKKPRKNRPPRTVKISARVPFNVAAAKPPGMSWGDFIVKLLATHSKRDLYAADRTRYAAWAAICLDRLAQEIPKRFPNDSSLTAEEQINRLAALAALLLEIAASRKAMEEIIDGN